MYSFLLVLLLGASPADSLPEFHPRVLNIAEPPPPPKDCYRYRVVYRWHGQRCIRWRTDWVLTTVVANAHDTVGVNMTASQLVAAIDRTPLPDTARVAIHRWVARYEQRRDGTVTRQYLVRRFDEDRLRRLDIRWEEQSQRIALDVPGPPGRGPGQP